MAKNDVTFEIDGQPGGTPGNLAEITLSANWGTVSHLHFCANKNTSLIRILWLFRTC